MVQSEDPVGSWWIGLDRPAFDARAAAELPRMQRSKFGRQTVKDYVNWDREERFRPTTQEESDDDA